MSLPEALQGAVAGWLGTHAGNRRQASTELSATYRAGGSSAGVDLGSYLVARLPATFAAVDRVLAELAKRRPDMSPDSLLDAGSGPGTAAWAAVGRWPGLETVTFLDNARAFLDLAVDLSRHGPPPLAAARALQGQIQALPDGLSADLAIADAHADVHPQRTSPLRKGHGELGKAVRPVVYEPRAKIWNCRLKVRVSLV